MYGRRVKGKKNEMVEEIEKSEEDIEGMNEEEDTSFVKFKITPRLNADVLVVRGASEIGR